MSLFLVLGNEKAKKKQEIETKAINYSIGCLRFDRHKARHYQSPNEGCRRRQSQQVKLQTRSSPKALD